MQSEYKYFTFFVFIFFCIIFTFSLLFYKYTYVSLFHFAEMCSQSLNSFFTSWYHITGFTILIGIICLTGCLFLKFFLSTVKTEKKKNLFISTQLSNLPRNIKQIVTKRKIEEESVVVVRRKESLAFTLGFFSQKIVLTTGLCKTLTAKELEAVILHEQYHLKSNHGLALLVGKLISSTFFFLPFLKDMYTHMKSLFEYKADEHALYTQETKIHLISSINKISNHTHKFEFAPGFAVCTIEERLARLHGLKRSDEFFSIRKYSSTLPILLLVTFLFVLPIGTHANESDTITNASCENNIGTNSIQSMSIQLFSPR